MHIRLKLIQVIRGAAAIIVILHHITASTREYFKANWLAGFFKSGWNGVDIFFVLSGFIITFIHLNDVIKRRNVKTFFLKRFNRVYPIFWIVNITFICLLIVEKKYTQYDFNVVTIFKSFLLASTDEKLLPVRVSWSLCYEVLFYMVFGVCILLGARLSKLVWATWLAAIVVFYIFVDRLNPPVILNPFILEFLMGCVVGYVFKVITIDETKFSWFQNNRKLLICFGLALFISMWMVSYLTDYGQKNLIESRIVYGSSACLIILGAALTDYHGAPKIPAMLLLIGDASYVIYLTHISIVAFVFKFSYSIFKAQISPLMITIVGICAALLAVIFGVFFHLAIEKPLLKKLNVASFKKPKPVLSV